MPILHDVHASAGFIREDAVRAIASVPNDLSAKALSQLKPGRGVESGRLDHGAIKWAPVNRDKSRGHK
jgi:hypothetical protein